MAQELVKMSSKELDRLAVIRKVLEGRPTQLKAGEFIGLSERQVRRLCVAFEKRGAAGLVSGKRGRPSNRRLSEELRSRSVEIVVEPGPATLPFAGKRVRVFEWEAGRVEIRRSASRLFSSRLEHWSHPQTRPSRMAPAR